MSSPARPLTFAPSVAWPIALLRRWAALALCCAALFGATPAAWALAQGAPEPLMLDDDAPDADAWPTVTIRSDPGAAMTLADVLAAATPWTVPTGPHANLGPRPDAVWLRVPLQVRNGDGRWILDIDYVPLNEVEIYLLREGRLELSWRLGAAIPFAQRPMATRTHAVELQLDAGVAYEVLVRVRTQSAMLVPLRLSKPDAFHAREARVQLVQGMLAGVALALLVYGVGHWLSLRRSLFGWYALMLLGTATFFFHLSGLMQQHLFGELDGLLGKMSPLAVLVAMTGGARFVALALDTRRHHRRLHLGLQAMAVAPVVAIAVSLAVPLGYRPTQVLATVLGPLLMLVAVPAAWLAARRGERTGTFMLIGWGTYALGALAMAGLLRGALPANPLTQNLFQIGWVVEVFAWMRVLGLHVAELHESTVRTASEKRSLERLAATDALTGLPNRRGLHAALGGALAVAGPQRPLAVFLIDLDGFKPVNDQFGHYAGDTLLVQVGQRLSAQISAQLGEGGLVARLGGDEFVVMAAALRSEEEALMLGRRLLAAFGEPFTVDGRHCRVGLTIGLALAPLDGDDADALLRVADAAMYAGKQAGRNCLRRGVSAPTSTSTPVQAAADAEDAVTA